MTYIPKHQLSGEYKLNNPPPEHKPWTPRKTLVVAAAGRVDRDKFNGIEFSNLRMHYVNECIEDIVNQWKQNNTHRAARSYYANASSRAIHNLIIDVVKHKVGLT